MAMEEFEKKDFSKILKHNALEGRRWMNSTSSDAVRVYDRNLLSFPITVDLYGPYARAVDYSDGGMSEDDRTVAIDLISRFLYVERDKVIWKERKKREGREQHEKEDESLRIAVHENGLEFECELRSYTDTGLFLDQALTRSYIESISMGMKVLNLFSYTGSFSVYAAYGGAERVDSVDLSNVYTAWARENLDNNGFFDRNKYPTCAEDAETFIETAIRERKKWDIIIFDPPAFSNSHKAHDFDLKKDYLFYLYNFTKILTDGGVVIFSENLSSFNLDKGKIKAYYKSQEVTDELRAFGFSKKRSSVRIFRLEKVKEFKGEMMKRIIDDDSLEMLSLGDEGEKKERKPFKKEERRERRPERREFERGERRGYGVERGSFKDRKPYTEERRWEGGRRDSERPSYRRDSDSYRERRRYDDRPSFRDDYEERPRRRDYERPRDDRWNRDDRPQRRDYDDRPRRRDWEERPSYRREYDDERPRRSFDDRPRRPRDAEERPRRPRKAPVPYGYDEFRRTKGRDEKKDDE